MADGVLDGLEVWSLDLDDLALVGNKTGATRLGFAVLLKFFESRARFPLDRARPRHRRPVLPATPTTHR